VNVSEEGYDLYDGLAGFLDDTIDFEGKKAKMEVELLDLPPLLQIQLQVRRFTADSHVNLILHPKARPIRSPIDAAVQIECLCQIWCYARYGTILSQR
jgi:hypothetical protein